MKDREQLLKELHKDKQRTQIANIKEELDLYEHDQFTLTVLYLTLKKNAYRTGGISATCNQVSINTPKHRPHNRAGAFLYSRICCEMLGFANKCFGFSSI